MDFRKLLLVFITAWVLIGNIFNWIFLWFSKRKKLCTETTSSQIQNYHNHLQGLNHSWSQITG